MIGDLRQIASFPKNRDKLFFLAMTTKIGVHWESKAGGEAASLTLPLSNDI